MFGHVLTGLTPGGAKLDEGRASIGAHDGRVDAGVLEEAQEIGAAVGVELLTEEEEDGNDRAGGDVDQLATVGETTVFENGGLFGFHGRLGLTELDG